MRRERRLLAAALGAALALGCASRSLPPPPPKPPLVERRRPCRRTSISWFASIWRGCGAHSGPASSPISRRAAQASSGLEGTDTLLGPLFEHTDVLFVGVRPRLATELDHVIVLEGRFDDFDPAASTAEPPWQRSIDLGGDVRRWDRRLARRPRRAGARVRGRHAPGRGRVRRGDRQYGARRREGREPGRALAPEQGRDLGRGSNAPARRKRSQSGRRLWRTGSVARPSSRGARISISRGSRVDLARAGGLTRRPPKSSRQAVEGLLELVATSRPALGRAGSRRRARDGG